MFSGGGFGSRFEKRREAKRRKQRKNRLMDLGVPQHEIDEVEIENIRNTLKERS